MAADILIVDDSCQPTLMIKDLLAQIDYTAVICENVQQALAMVDLYRPHFMLVNQTVVDELTAFRLFESIRQINPGVVWVSIPLHKQSNPETQYPLTMLDDYLSGFRFYRVRRLSDDHMPVENAVCEGN